MRVFDADLLQPVTFAAVAQDAEHQFVGQVGFLSVERFGAEEIIGEATVFNRLQNVKGKSSGIQRHIGSELK